MHGLPTIGTIGFGWFDVSGRSRVPSPPAITTAFTGRALPARLTTYDAAARPAASTMPAQKSHSGHVVPSCVTIMRPSDAYRTQVAAFPSEADRELVAARHDELVADDQQQRRGRG